MRGAASLISGQAISISISMQFDTICCGGNSKFSAFIVWLLMPTHHKSKLIAHCLHLLTSKQKHETHLNSKQQWISATNSKNKKQYRAARRSPAVASN
jgi:predicted Fe-S protein YdhL (DUF1289 family)